MLTRLPGFISVVVIMHPDKKQLRGETVCLNSYFQVIPLCGKSREQELERAGHNRSRAEKNYHIIYHMLPYLLVLTSTSQLSCSSGPLTRE